MAQKCSDLFKQHTIDWYNSWTPKYKAAGFFALHNFAQADEGWGDWLELDTSPTPPAHVFNVKTVPCARPL